MIACNEPCEPTRMFTTCRCGLTLDLEAVAEDESRLL